MTNQIILSYRLNDSKTRKPNWSGWLITAHTAIDNARGVAEIICKFNNERAAFRNIEYKLDIGTIKGGAILPCETDEIEVA